MSHLKFITQFIYSATRDKYSTLLKMPIVHFPPLCGEKWGGFGGETQYFAKSKILCFSSKPPLRTAFGGEHKHISKK